MRLTDRSPANRMPRAAIVEPLGDTHAERLARAAQAAHMLSETAWETLHEQLDARFERDRAIDADGAPVERAAELAERLADIAATVALLAGAHRRATATPAPEVVSTAPPAAAAPTSAGAPSRAELIDERDEPEPQPGPRPSPAASPRSQPAQTSPRPRPWDEAAAARSPTLKTRQDLLLDDARRAEPAAWTGMIASALEGFERDQLPFAGVLVEVPDLERPAGHPAQLPALTPEIHV